jgi:hypothetical protein
MPEPRELIEARRCLAEAEAGYRSADALACLAEGLALLEDVIGGGAPVAANTARNLASTYAARIFGRVHEVVARDAQVPEPELEHFFKLVLAFDQVDFALPESANVLKIDVVRQLIERYYEGHSPERKQQALQELEQLARRT